MRKKELYDFPGGVCPSCEHYPLNVCVSTSDNETILISYYCPECGAEEWLAKTENVDTSQRNNSLQPGWKKKVLTRDGHACVICGETVNVDAHHLISASAVPGWQSKLSNGITLCRRCHKLLHDTTTKWPEKYR